MRLRRFHVLKFIAFVVMGISLSACASGAKVDGMVAGADFDPRAPHKFPARHAVSISAVEGGSNALVLWGSKVSTDSFEEALQESLKNNQFLASGKGKYRMHVNLLHLTKPVFAGDDMTVTAHVQYRIAKAKYGRVMFNETIVTPYTVNLYDALLESKRMRLANEGVMRANILAFITKIKATKGLGK